MDFYVNEMGALQKKDAHVIKDQFSNYNETFTKLETEICPIITHHHKECEHFLERGENLFVKKICKSLWKKFEYRLNRIEDNVFEGSELSSARSHSVQSRNAQKITSNREKGGDRDLTKILLNPSNSRLRSEIDSKSDQGDESYPKISAMTKTITNGDQDSINGS